MAKKPSSKRAPAAEATARRSARTTARAATRTGAGRQTTRRPSAGRILLVLGGSASGKSQVALDLAGAASPRVFLATGEGRDREMAARIARHRATRPRDWVTAEVPVDLTTWLQREGHRYRTILLDCLTLWLSNLLGTGLREAALPTQVDHLMSALRATGARVVLVSNELGMGLVPVGPSSRRFRDLAGRLNQQVAAAADDVVLVVAGLPMVLKQFARTE